MIGPKEVFEDTVVAPVKPVIRKATPKDLKQIEKNKEREEKAFEICLEKIGKRKLPMKLINVEYTFDMNKIIFFFTADGRIDFRELVKDLATAFRTRIELRQVGVRDESKVLNGIGACGRPFAVLISRVILHLFRFAWLRIKLEPKPYEDFWCLWSFDVLPPITRMICIKGWRPICEEGTPSSPSRCSASGIGKEVVTDEGIGKGLEGKSSQAYCKG